MFIALVRDGIHQGPIRLWVLATACSAVVVGTPEVALLLYRRHMIHVDLGKIHILAVVVAHIVGAVLVVTIAETCLDQLFFERALILHDNNVVSIKGCGCSTLQSHKILVADFADITFKANSINSVLLYNVSKFFRDSSYKFYLHKFPLDRDAVGLKLGNWCLSL